MRFADAATISSPRRAHAPAALFCMAALGAWLAAGQALAADEDDITCTGLSLRFTENAQSWHGSGSATCARTGVISRSFALSAQGSGCPILSPDGDALVRSGDDQFIVRGGPGAAASTTIVGAAIRSPSGTWRLDPVSGARFTRSADGTVGVQTSSASASRP